MKILIDHGDGTDLEELEVTDGSFHFHPFPDDLEEGTKPEITVEVLEDDPVPEDVEEDEDVEDEEFSEEDVEDEEEGLYDPGNHTVTEVLGYVEDNPDELEDVLAAERAGKDRVTLISHLESMREA